MKACSGCHCPIRDEKYETDGAWGKGNFRGKWEVKRKHHKDNQVKDEQKKALRNALHLLTAWNQKMHDVGIDILMIRYRIHSRTVV